MGRQSYFLMSPDELKVFLGGLEKRGAYFVDLNARVLSIESIVSGELHSFHIGFTASRFQTCRETLELLPLVRRVEEPKHLHEFAFSEPCVNAPAISSEDHIESCFSDVIEIFLGGQYPDADSGQKVYNFSTIQLSAYDPPAWLQKEYDYIVRKIRRDAEMRHEFAIQWYIYVYPEIAEEIRCGFSTIVKPMRCKDSLK